MCDMPRSEPTQTETDIAGRQLTTTEHQQMLNSVELKKFYEDFLDAFGSTIVHCACCKCIPPWLLASVVLGEVTAMDTFFGIDERTLEELSLGSSVGLAQMTAATAIKYGCTESAKNFEGLCNFVARRMGQLWGPEAIYAEWSTKAFQDLDVSPAPLGSNPRNPDVRELAEYLVRAELLRYPKSNICASACYLQQLLHKFRALGRVRNYVLDDAAPEPWGQFDFSEIVECNSDILRASLYPAADEQMRRLAKLFGAAHNDDATSGYKMRVGMTQGENAGSVADDLIGFGLIAKYNLQTCAPEHRCRHSD